VGRSRDRDHSIGERCISYAAAGEAAKGESCQDKTALYILYEVVDKVGFEKIAGAATSKEA
jgi:hypothetical protein